MLTLHRQRKIKFFPVEKTTQWLLYACVVEMEGETVVFVSEPRLVKVTRKEIARLPGSILSLPQALPEEVIASSYVSPLSAEFRYKSALNTIWYNARPPTVK